MKKSLKVLAATGLSTMLLASGIFPATASTKTASIVEKQKSGFSNVIKNPQLEKKARYSEDSFIIKYNRPLSAAEHKAAGGTLVKSIKQLNYSVVKVKNKKNLVKVMKTYQKLGKVESVSPSALYTLQGSMGDPKANQQYQLDMLQADKAQSLAGKHKVTVAVIDMGTDPNHPDLKGNLLPGINVGNPANTPVAMDHGTHVSGIIGATKGNGEGGYGINPNVKILPIDVLDGNNYYLSDYILADGILKAVEKGAKVINMSLGMGVYSPLTDAAIQTATSKGVVVVAAAGNESSDSVNYPAGNEGVISVGSINSEKKLSDFSNFGPSVDLVAPGENVYSTLHDGRKSTYAAGSGTSMASPVVAGVASLLLSKHPKLTPAQVEYILEQTADDLGEKEFDTKYANGLVNPVKALSYDIKKLPKYVKEEWSKEEILKNAEQVNADKKIVKEGAITKPFEQKWIKLDVKKGDYIQTHLEGSKNYDYKIMAHFFSNENKVQSQEVNRTQDGSSEAKLLVAPFDGTLALGVKDVNGSFDDTAKKLSTYKLNVEQASKLPEDESAPDQMVEIASLPYKLPTPFTLAGEKEDYDYFRFTVKEDQTVRINMSAIPGLNTDIGVYNISGIFAENPDLKPEEKAQLLKEMLEGKEPMEQEYYANSKGNSQGEKLVFKALQGEEYVIRTGGNAEDYYDFFFLLLFGFTIMDEEKESSLLPYTLDIESKQIPVDEDGLTDTLFEEDEMVHEDSQSAEVANRENVLSSFTKSAEETTDSYLEEQNKMIRTIMEAGRPYEIGAKSDGYLQDDVDLDAFIVDSNETAIYEFNVANKENILPLVTVFEIVQEKDEKGNEYLYLDELGQNVDWNSFDVTTKEKLYTVMEKGKKYLIKINNNYYGDSISTSVEPYELTSKKLISNPVDKYEPSDWNKPKNLPATSFQANFAMPYDSDFYYYTANDNGVKSVSIEVGKVTEAMKKRYPAELLQQYYGIGTIIEDSNKNRIFDEYDNEIQMIYKGPEDFSSGSFKTKKGVGYFIVARAEMFSSTPLTVIPYTLQFTSMNRKDESTSRSPMVMKKESVNLQSAKGYINAGVTGGDSDWFVLDVPKDRAVKVKLEAGKEADGVVSIYQNGKLIKESNSYLQADNEEFVLNLKKGKYHIKVSDANGSSSVTPYTLKAYLK